MYPESFVSFFPSSGKGVFRDVFLFHGMAGPGDGKSGVGALSDFGCDERSIYGASIQAEDDR